MSDLGELMLLLDHGPWGSWAVQDQRIMYLVSRSLIMTWRAA